MYHVSTAICGFVLCQLVCVLNWHSQALDHGIFSILTSDGSLKISLNNDGNAHIQIINFSLSKPGSSQPWITQQASDYVLIGQSLDWVLPASADYSIPQSGTSIKLFAETDAGDIEAEVLVSP